MPQVRFNIGIPRGGSAARIAEDSAGTSAGSLRPRAGSAARDAEDRRRAELVPVQRAASISLRADGGKKFTGTSPEILHAKTQVNNNGAEPASNVLMERLQSGPILPAALTASNLPEIDAPLSGRDGALPEHPTGPLHTAADRIKSLVQSLFSTGSKPGKP